MKDRYDIRNGSHVMRDAAGVRYFGIYADPGADDLENEHIARLEAIGEEMRESGIPVQLQDGSVCSREEYAALLEKVTGFPASFGEKKLNADFVGRYLAAKENKNLRGVAVHYMETFGGLEGENTLMPVLVCEESGSDTDSEKQFTVFYRQGF